MQKVSKLVIQTMVFLLPLFFLPVTNDFFDFNKNYLLFLFAGASILLFVVQSIKERRASITVSSLDIPILLLLVSFVSSLLIAAPNKVQALLEPTSAGTIIALIILYFFLRQLVGSKLQELLTVPITASAIILSAISLVNVTGIASKLPVSALFKSGTFTPAGTLITLASYLIIAIVFLYKDTIVSKKIAERVRIGVLAILIAGLIATVIVIARPANRPLFLPFPYGWSISLDTLKIGKTALFGVGPGNFLNAFTITKPAAINMDPVWLYRYNTSSSFLFTIFTENGLLGLTAFLLLIYRLIRLSKKSAALFVAAIMLLLMPANILLLMFFFIMLAAVSAHRTVTLPLHHGLPTSSDEANTGDLHDAYHSDTTQKLHLPTAPPAIYLISTVLILFASLVASYFLIRWYQADVAMARGIRLAATTDNQGTYTSMVQALQLNPYNSTYRIVFSRTALALAYAVSRKETLTDNDKKTISDLVTQSVTSAKGAIQLSPSVVTWENLAVIYSNLILSTNAAIQWTATAYNQTLLFDPNNPILRVNVGGFYYSLKQYEIASRQFEIALSLKNDYANAWYNYANVQRERGNFDISRAAYERTLALVTEGTPDFDRAKSEMDALPKSAPNDETLKGLTELTSPQATPSSNIQTPVKLSEESAPEIKPETVPPQSPTASESAEPIFIEVTITPVPTL